MSEQKDMQTEEKVADATPERSAKKPEGAATTPHSAQCWEESSPEAQSKKVVAAAETVREYAVPRDDGKGLPAERLVPSTEDVRLQAMGGKDLLRIMPKVLRSGSSGADVLCTVTDLMALGGAYEHELGDRVRRLAGNCEVRLQVATRALDGGSRLLGAQLAAEASREAFLEFARVQRQAAEEFTEAARMITVALETARVQAATQLQVAWRRWSAVREAVAQRAAVELGGAGGNGCVFGGGGGGSAAGAEGGGTCASCG